MEIYKLSCPRCGQHIEYTKEYCGRHMQCPSCAGNVTFPAIPPGARKQALRLERDRPKVKERFHFDIGKILGAIVTWFRTFEYWQIVAMCALPFVLIGLALATASFIRKQDSQSKPKEAVLSEAQIAENQRIVQLNKADMIVQDRVRSVWTAKTALDNAKRKSVILHNSYDGKQMSEGMRNAVNAQYKVADEEVATADANFQAWRRYFDTAYQNYQKLGGKIDYQSQLPR
jgi:hypothetical protein